MLMERQVVSADAFLELVELPEYADRRLELVEGEIVEMAGPGGEHGETLSLIHAKLAGYVYARGLGRVAVGDSTFVLGIKPDGRDTIRGIDLAFLRADKAPYPLPSGVVSTPPDLAIEVISPSNTASDIAKKIQQLFDAGTELIWIVYPDLRAVAVHTLDGAIMLNEDDTLRGGDILPGFVLPVSEIFPI